ncbi:VWA domain-containing protein [Azohydromonas caseinilytica]|uniref:VWA domain-containing protein n=1 Tax=Azohydromonas caseinilytica TaxID=2728836 RepID=A0A848FIF8_9BURK|nr:VWA domain-containing protein [Azohydromonas caseinilytica]NML19032.1 VWA domain-containing protein [Azohydromonas caseinilytica]
MAADLDRPYDQLQALPRSLWLPSLITSAGERGQRLADARLWLDRLTAGVLPPADADFGDAAASVPLRRVVGELGLPSLARGVPALAEQVLRTLLWHLDRIVDHQPRLSRDEAIARITEAFRSEWTLESAGLEEHLALLRSLGDLGHMRWDELHGQLHSRSWQAARRASEWLQQLPALVALIRRLGRAERSATAAAPQSRESARHAPPQALRAIETRLPDAPGEIVGVRFSSRPERMLASEAVMLRHPVLKKLWRARHAEARLLSWETQAVLTDWRADPQAPTRRRAAQAEPEPLERGPIILCLDTSGSMRGAPENIAKAVAIAALRAAHEQGRDCKLIAFGGPNEVLERDLGGGGGLQGLLDLMGQSFDGGTDIQTPIERAIERVHEAHWHHADVLLVSDGEFGCVPHTLQRLDEAQARFGLRVQGVLVGDRETIGLLEVCDDIHWVRDWRRYADAAEGGDSRGFSPVHSKSLTALYFPNALSPRAARHATGKTE